MKIRELPHTQEVEDLMLWLGKIKTKAFQINTVNSADCELIRLDSKRTLALTIDTLSDEMECGLYKDPFTVGWMTATISLSDLSAVGANPIGVLISTNWKSRTRLSYKKEFSRGLKAALQANRTSLLGGDSGSSSAEVITSTGVGLVKGQLVQRTGIRPGDLLCHVGLLGSGPALGFTLLKKGQVRFEEKHYRPQAQLSAGQQLRPLARAMMDTSDGFMSSVHTLSILNRVSFELFWNPQVFDSRAAKVCFENNLPLSSLLFAEHGDYQLLVSLPPSQLSAALRKVPNLYPVGRAVAKRRHVVYHTPAGACEIPLSKFFNSPRRTMSEIKKYFDSTTDYLKARGLP